MLAGARKPPPTRQEPEMTLEDRYVKRFGKKPNPRWKAETIRQRLNDDTQ